MNYLDKITEVLGVQDRANWYATSQIPTSQKPWAAPLDDFSEIGMIMELIGRGYAVSKLPVDDHMEAVK